MAIAEDVRSPGEEFWTIAYSSDVELRLPADPRRAFSLNIPVAPWLDEPVWCLEMAKRNRNSPIMTNESRAQLKALLAQSGEAKGV